MAVNAGESSAEIEASFDPTTGEVTIKSSFSSSWLETLHIFIVLILFNAFFMFYQKFSLLGLKLCKPANLFVSSHLLCHLMQVNDFRGYSSRGLNNHFCTDFGVFVDFTGKCMIVGWRCVGVWTFLCFHSILWKVKDSANNFFSR